MLRTLKKSVLSDAVPEIMQQSYFSTLYIYIHLALPLNAAYFLLYYDWLFFREIRGNAWYLLIKTGYLPSRMIFLKFLALLLSVTAVYGVGYLTVLLLTMLLKYTFIAAYLPTLFLAGLTELALLTAAAMTASLIGRDTASCRYLTALSALLLPLLKQLTGYYAVLKNRAAMQDLRNLFDPAISLYMPLAAVLLLSFTAVCSLRAGSLARYYAVGEEESAGGLPPGATLSKPDPRTGSLRPVGEKPAHSPAAQIAGVLLTAVSAAFIGLALLFNGFILLISTSTPGNEITIRGVIPYIFQSDTMQPDILQNDLAYFRRVDAQSPVKVGEIVLFRHNNVVYVERIIEQNADGITVDIDHYPPLSESGAMVRTISREDIYGVYSGKNRWLGALILFANTIIGRLLFLLVPAVLLFYRKPLMKLLRAASH